MRTTESSEHFAARLAEIAFASIGVGLVVCAIAANQRWLDRHFLSDFFYAREDVVRVEAKVRITIAVAGTLLALLIRRPLARFLVHDPLRTLFTFAALIASFCAAELVLQQSRLRAKEEVATRFEPSRHLDPRLGWLFVTPHVGFQKNNGRLIQYAFDRNGYRVGHVDEPVDPTLPTILFSGESMMVGEKLHWEETIPAQTGQLLGIQSANVAVSGFATDQAYLRLKDELPRFRHPVAVVMLFSPALFDRNFDDDRPHLGPGLIWLPAERRWRLAFIARRLVRYRSNEAIERGVAGTREVLRATVELALARGAVPLILVPEFRAEEPGERMLRARILDEPGLPYVRVELDPTWRILNDGHPDPRAAHAIAVAIAERLRAPMKTASRSD
ncbi:MAG TPA: hypothetical protein VHL58_10865 [Thermoanaerobaculia bacterium]|nr:hypothetical protein [Thermoanaerobaculia bacterium]